MEAYADGKCVASCQHEEEGAVHQPSLQVGTVLGEAELMGYP